MKKQRQETILEIIKKQPVETQEQLKELLECENVQVTQATLSRDIRELGLKKAYDSDGNYRYTAPAGFTAEFPPMFLDSVIGIDYAMNTVVIRCHTGMANAACAMLDKIEYTDIVGTIAGDDTIFALMKTEVKAKAFSDMMNKLIFK
jgi:transcriptional regulator of arginine metabolism